MKAEEFVNFVNRSIAPESGLHNITVEDLRRWHEMGFLSAIQNTTDLICRLC
jgi:hypothetical protein